jgi:hypothetical protein
MKNRNLLGLAVLLLLMAALFFGSVMCPPASERTAADAADDPARAVEAAPGLTRGDAPVEPLRDATPGTESATVDEILVRVTDLEGRPLLGAEIVLNWADRPGTGVAARGNADANGVWLFKRLPQARYRLHAVASGYFPSAEPQVVLIPAVTRPEVVLPLERGGLITGFVHGLDGVERPFGWLRFRDLDRGTTALVRSDERGAFNSGPLRRGAWEVSWIKHEQAEADPRLKWTVVTEPGALTELLVTVDEVGEGREARAGRAVGIVPNARGG